MIRFSILGVLPFTLLLPHANLFETGVLSVFIGAILSTAFSAIVVFAQELVPGRVGAISGLFLGFAFGAGGLGAALLGRLADATSIQFVFKVRLVVRGLIIGDVPVSTCHRASWFRNFVEPERKSMFLCAVLSPHQPKPHLRLPTVVSSHCSCLLAQQLAQRPIIVLSRGPKEDMDPYSPITVPVAWYVTVAIASIFGAVVIAVMSPAFKNR